MRFGISKKKAQATNRRTAVTFSAEDLAAVARLLSAGQAMLQLPERFPVVARLRVPVPRGL